uniref:Uncharacterized protein n=1 Tax=Haptolina ericina TaxID=156174 RepID=A0A7S3AL33_9EUKA
MQHLLAGAAHTRGSSDGVGYARLLEAAAQAIQQQMAEAKVQRGLAIASQTIASELALKCEQLQQRIEERLSHSPKWALPLICTTPPYLHVAHDGTWKPDCVDRPAAVSPQFPMSPLVSQGSPPLLSDGAAVSAPPPQLALGAAGRYSTIAAAVPSPLNAAQQDIAAAQA